MPPVLEALVDKLICCAMGIELLAGPTQVEKEPDASPHKSHASRARKVEDISTCPSPSTIGTQRGLAEAWARRIDP